MIGNMNLVNPVNPVDNHGNQANMKDSNLTETIIGCAFKVHNTLGPGFLEQVYENALRIELVKQGLQIKQQAPIEVNYEGQVVGSYYADLWVEDRVI